MQMAIVPRLQRRQQQLMTSYASFCIPPSAVCGSFRWVCTRLSATSSGMASLPELMYPSGETLLNMMAIAIPRMQCGKRFDRHQCAVVLQGNPKILVLPSTFFYFSSIRLSKGFSHNCTMLFVLCTLLYNTPHSHPDSVIFWYWKHCKINSS